MKYKLKIQIRVQGAVVAALLCLFVSFAPGVTSAAQINNNVSVESSSGNGPQSSSVAVKTEVNGNVVEDYKETSTSGSISYSSHINTDGVVATSTVDTSFNTLSKENDARQEALIKILRELIRLLVQANTAS